MAVAFGVVLAASLWSSVKSNAELSISAAFCVKVVEFYVALGVLKLILIPVSALILASYSFWTSSIIDAELELMVVSVVFAVVAFATGVY